MSLDLDRTTWKSFRLGDVIRRSREQVDPIESGVDRYVGGGHINGESITIDRWGNPSDGQMGSTFRYVFEPGQILFVSARPYLRKFGVVNFSGVVADKTYVLDAIPENGLLQEFLPFVLASEPFIAYASAEATGSMNPRLLWGPFQRYELDLPPLDEQKRIADLLWAVERQAEAEAVQATAVQRAMSDYCLTTYLSLDRGYKRAPIVSIAEPRMGRQKSPKYATGVHSTPYLRVANIGALELNLDEVEEMDFGPTDRANFELLPGDVVLTEGDIVSPMNVGRPAIFSGELPGICFQNTLIRLRPTNRTHPLFLMALCEGMRLAGVFAATASTTTVTHLGLRRLSALEVPRVDYVVQARIARDLRALLSLRDASRSAQASLATLRRALVAEIFGGD